MECARAESKTGRIPTNIRNGVELIGDAIARLSIDLVSGISLRVYFGQNFDLYLGTAVATILASSPPKISMAPWVRMINQTFRPVG